MRLVYQGPVCDGQVVVDGRSWPAKPGEATDFPADVGKLLAGSGEWVAAPTTRKPAAKPSKKETSA